MKSWTILLVVALTVGFGLVHESRKASEKYGQTLLSLHRGLR